MDQIICFCHSFGLYFAAFYVSSKLHIYIKYHLLWPCTMNSRVCVLVSLLPVLIALFWCVKIVYITNNSFYKGLCKVFCYNNILTTHGT